MPFDGHFLPMTGLAQRLRREGHDVRFYAGRSFAGRLERRGVPHVPFRRAAEINGQNLAEHFPEIDKLKGSKRVAFDVEKIFFPVQRACGSCRNVTARLWRATSRSWRRR
jgi:hypothetical protein